MDKRTTMLSNKEAFLPFCRNGRDPSMDVLNSTGAEQGLASFHGIPASFCGPLFRPWNNTWRWPCKTNHARPSNFEQAQWNEWSGHGSGTRRWRRSRCENASRNWLKQPHPQRQHNIAFDPPRRVSAFKKRLGQNCGLCHPHSFLEAGSGG